MPFRVEETEVVILKGDITEQTTEAIVNAANSSLLGGGGVDGAIHRKGGPRILEECRRIRADRWPDGLPAGEAVITTGGDLKARYVIHTVGPVWRGGSSGEPAILRSCYTNSLKLAASWAITSIAFPAIGTGAYGYPIDAATKVALDAVKEFVQGDRSVKQIVFVPFSDADLRAYENSASRMR